MLLLELAHLSFEQWFLRQFQQGLLSEGYFRIGDLRVEYLSLCWKEERLWKEWCDG